MFNHNQSSNEQALGRNSTITLVITTLIVIIVTFTIVWGSFYFTADTQNAVLTTFGGPSLVQKSGLHFKIPLIQRVRKVDMTSRGMAIGYTEKDDKTISNEAVMITKDFNFLEVFFYLEYQVSDPIKFLYNSEQPELILSNLAQSAIRDTVGIYGVDDVLTSSRAKIEEKVREVLNESLNKADIGIKINNATIQDVDTPTDKVKAAFDRVESAKQDAEDAQNKAQQYKAEKIPEAQGKADKLIQEAEGQKEARIEEANGQASRFNSLYEQYKNAPEVTKLRMYYEVMEEVMPNVKVVITNDDGSIVNVYNQPTGNSK